MPTQTKISDTDLRRPVHELHDFFPKVKWGFVFKRMQMQLYQTRMRPYVYLKQKVWRSTRKVKPVIVCNLFKSYLSKIKWVFKIAKWTFVSHYLFFSNKELSSIVFEIRFLILEFNAKGHTAGRPCIPDCS